MARPCWQIGCPLLILSEKYPELLVVGIVQFHNGAAEVEDLALIERLRKFAAMGVVVPERVDPPKEKPATPARRRSPK